MKKFILVLLLIAAASVGLSADGINLGDFPLGKWLDAKWSAVWEFESNNIRILDEAGAVYYDFEGKTIEDFSVKPSTKGIVLSFYCVETGKKYTFTKPVTNMKLMMEINTDTGINYETELPLQK